MAVGLLASRMKDFGEVAGDAPAPESCFFQSKPPCYWVLNLENCKPLANEQPKMLCDDKIAQKNIAYGQKFSGKFIKGPNYMCSLFDLKKEELFSIWRQSRFIQWPDSKCCEEIGACD